MSEESKDRSQWFLEQLRLSEESMRGVEQAFTIAHAELLTVKSASRAVLETDYLRLLRREEELEKRVAELREDGGVLALSLIKQLMTAEQWETFEVLWHGAPKTIVGLEKGNHANWSALVTMAEELS